MLHRVVVELHAVIEFLVFGRRVDRGVDGMERHVHEPRLFAALGDALQGLGGDEFGGVAFLAEEFPVAMPGIFVGITFAVFMRPRIGGAGECAVTGVEAVSVGDPLWSGAEVPLAGEVGAVAD